MRLAKILFFLSLAAACTPDFEDETHVKDLRLLAVSAEPSELVVDLEAVLRGEVPDLGIVALTPLIVDPRGGGREVEYRVLACGNNVATMEDGRDHGPGNVRDTISNETCPPGSMLVAEGRIAGRAEDGVVPLKVTFTPTPELLVRALMADPVSIQLGLPITVGFTLRAGTEEVVGLKRVIFTPRLAPDQTPNRNPVMATLSFRPTKKEMAMPFMAGAPPPEVDLGGKLNLIAGPAEAEAYRARAVSRMARGDYVIEEVPKETLRYAFFATKGTFAPGEVSTEVLPFFKNQTIDLETTYHAPTGLAPEESRDVEVFVVVRDERGGASFVQTRLRIR